jgi:hypothetical protein
MNTRLVIDESSKLQELRETSHQPQNLVIRFLANVISYVFHPLFVPVYVAWFLITVQPYLFSSFTASDKAITLVRFFIMYSFFPLVTVLIAKGLGFLDSIFLKTQKERIIPYIACGIYYFWMCYVLRNQPQFSKEVVQFSMAIFISSSIGLLANIYMKVSMHSISMGIVLAFMAQLAFSQGGNYTVYLSVALLLTGLVCTARFIVSDHTQKEIYTGLAVGILSQLIAIWADGILP